MKTFLITIVLFLFAFNVAQGSASHKSNCQIKKNIATEYSEWKTSFHKFLSGYESLNSVDRFKLSTAAMKNILEKIQKISDKTSIPLPLTAVNGAKGLLTEIEAGRIARTSANPTLKLTLISLEDSMDSMILKAQSKNPGCDLISRVTMKAK